MRTRNRNKRLLYFVDVSVGGLIGASSSEMIANLGVLSYCLDVVNTQSGCTQGKQGIDINHRVCIFNAVDAESFGQTRVYNGWNFSGREDLGHAHRPFSCSNVGRGASEKLTYIWPT